MYVLHELVAFILSNAKRLFYYRIDLTFLQYLPLGQQTTLRNVRAATAAPTPQHLMDTPTTAGRLTPQTCSAHPRHVSREETVVRAGPSTASS